MKGIVEYVIIFIFLLIIGIVVLFGGLFLGEFKEAANNTLVNASMDIIDKGITANQSWDIAIIFVIVGAFVGVAISGFYIRTHPIFFIIMIFLLGVIILLSAIFTNVFDDFATSSSMASTANDFPTLVEFFRNLPVYAGIFGMITLIIWYAKGRGEESV